MPATSAMDLVASGAYAVPVTKDFLKDRERGFEAEFFQRQDAKLIAKIRERAHLHEVALALSEKLRVDDPALLERVVRLGFTRETGASILLAPLVEVAWADGDVSNAERRAVLDLAAARGVEPGTPAHEQVLAWMRVRPSAELLETAMEVLRVGFGVLPPAERDQHIRELLDVCDRVAEASGGLAKLFGIGRGVSGEEARLLDELARKLRSASGPTT